MLYVESVSVRQAPTLIFFIFVSLFENLGSI